jgi:adenylylsulfate kinase
VKKYSQVIWITGLSGAGKTTLASAVVSRLRADGRPVVQLDGDELRDVLGAVASNVQNHGREARLALAMKYSHLCRLIASQGITVVIATISLFREIHQWNRQNLPGYFEVYLRVPIDELRRRDPKGIYRRFDTGELSDVAGFDLFIDEPQNPDLLVDFTQTYLADDLASNLIKRFFRERE